MLVGEAEQAMIAAVDALHHRATLSDAEFAALSAHFDEAKIFEIILLCGFYRTVSYLANGLETAVGGERRAVSGLTTPRLPATDRANE